MNSPYLNIINAIPTKELEVILKGLGYEKVQEKKEEEPKAKKMSQRQKDFENYRNKLKQKMYKH